MTVRATDTRRAAVWLVIALVTGLFLAAGCGGDDVTDPTFPPLPEPPTGTWFLGVWGSSANDVWIVGQPGLIYHWDGTAWERQDSGTERALTSVWGRGDGTVYITGHGGKILRKTSGSWSTMESGTGKNLFDINEYQGTIMASGRDATIRQLSGSSWTTAPDEVYIRNAEQAVIDTFLLSDDDDSNWLESLTSVAHHSVAGSNGAVLMEDPETSWQLRRVTGGRDWVTCATSAERLSGNFIATDGGRLFQLTQLEGDVLTWLERYSPALDTTIYGIFTDIADTVWAVTADGRINRVDPDNSFHELYEDGLILFDIWGTSGTNLYAVGIDGRVLHFTEINPGEYGWDSIELPDLPPTTKAHATQVFDKFGRPVP